MTSPIKLDQLDFPKASPLASKVLVCLSSESPDINEIDHIILQDPVLAGTVIRYANSPLYRRAGEISNVPTATRLIGMKNIRSAMVMSILRAICPVDSTLSKSILAHSLAISVLCKLIARHSCPGSADDLELMGLIHDIGMVVLATNFETEYKALLVQSQTEQLALDVLEKAHFGFSHDQIAAKALHEFRLPQRHEMVLTHFHQSDPDELDESMLLEQAVLALAHHLLAEQEEANDWVETSFSTVSELCTQLGINDDTLGTLREQAATIVSEREN